MVCRVSVVVPVYNPGEYIDPLIDSLLAQTMAASDFEVVFVDDGSTDDTPARLDRLAGRHPHIRVLHIPNSGWPGRPRNVGIEAARGEYVQFVDNDDVLGVESLDRLCDYAAANSSDVVLGKEVTRPGRWSVWPVFDRNRPSATLENDPLTNLLTPHKMFRRAFLDEHSIRFFEGPRRLEDHPFVMRAFFLAERISVLSDYAVYYWTRRPGRAGSVPEDWHAWYGFLHDALDVVEEFTEPGAQRNRLLSHWYRSKGLAMAMKVAGNPRHPTWPQQFDALQRLTEERFPPAVDDALPALHRVASSLVRTGDLSALKRLAALNRRLRLDPRLEAVSVVPDQLRLELALSLTFGDDEPLRLCVEGDQVLWQLPAEVRDLAGSGLEIAEKLRHPHYNLVLHHRATSEPFVLSATARKPPVVTAGRGRYAHHAVFDIDPVVGQFQRPLPRGVYDVYVKANIGGWTTRAPVLAAAEQRSDFGVLLNSSTIATVGVDARGRVHLDIGPRRRRHVLDTLVPRPSAATLEAGEEGSVRLLVPVDGPQAGGRPFQCKMTLGRADRDPVHVPMSLRPCRNGESARLVVDLRAEDLDRLQTAASGPWQLTGVVKKHARGLGLALTMRGRTVSLCDAENGAELSRTRVQSRSRRELVVRLTRRLFPGRAR